MIVSNLYDKRRVPVPKICVGKYFEAISWRIFNPLLVKRYLKSSENVGWTHQKICSTQKRGTDQ